MRRLPLWHVSITTSPEAEDAVAFLVERAFQKVPVVYLSEEIKSAEISVYSHNLREANARLRRELRDGLKEIRSCGLDTGPATIAIRKVRRIDWTQAWKRHFKPVKIRNSLLIKPGWSRQKPRNGQKVVVLDPGLSFGTGQHPTTLFCLEQLAVGRCAGRAQSFLDIGTGSGILAIAAAKLGYRPVEAFDLDPAAVRIAKANAARNGCAQSVRFSQRDLARLPVRPRSRFDLICANLTDDLLVGERDRIINHLKSGGVLVLAGILASQFATVHRAYHAAQLKLVTSCKRLDWHSASFRFAS
jgi:ribosomal protein L11 methyltransferase